METKEQQRPNAALINREWYEAARKVLTRSELAETCICAVEYIIFGSEPLNLSGSSAVVFAMIRPALDSDLAKYRDRCARNAANARAARERVAASGTQSQPVGANKTTTTTTTSTSTTTSITSLSPEEDEQRERWIVYGYFWSVGSSAISMELDAFWNYYSSLGWKNNKGAPIVSKLSCARMWKHQFDTHQAPNGADAWFAVMKNSHVADYAIWRAFRGAERTDAGAVVRLSATESWINDFKGQCAGLLASLARLWHVPDIIIERV